MIDPEGLVHAPGLVMAESLVEAGQVAADEDDRFVETVEEAARLGRFTMRLTMHSVIAAAPAGGD